VRCEILRASLATVLCRSRVVHIQNALTLWNVLDADAGLQQSLLRSIRAFGVIRRAVQCVAHPFEGCELLRIHGPWTAAVQARLTMLPQQVTGCKRCRGCVFVPLHSRRLRAVGLFVITWPVGHTR
jgi:hypothetical protein